MNKIEVYLEIGKKRVFASSIQWPGWCRSGRDEESALQVLCEYGRRYADVLRPTRFEFRSPSDASSFVVIERLEGDATTDFGAPVKTPSSDMRPVDDTELHRFQEVLKACWQAFDTASSAALGKELRKGPRGGGRNLEGIVQHVLNAEEAYLARLGCKMEKHEGHDLDKVRSLTRQAILTGLASAARGEIPAQGPRSGVRWTPRYFVRRVTWHVLDHAWELEDRIT
jgi:hypothetical protein